MIKRSVLWSFHAATGVGNLADDCPRSVRISPPYAIPPVALFKAGCGLLRPCHLIDHDQYTAVTPRDHPDSNDRRCIDLPMEFFIRFPRCMRTRWCAASDIVKYNPGLVDQPWAGTR